MRLQPFLLGIIMVLSVLVMGCSGSRVIPDTSPVPSTSAQPVNISYYPPTIPPIMANVTGPDFNRSSSITSTTLIFPSPISAMDGYETAEKAALAWNNDSVLAGVIGYTAKGSGEENVTIDGNCASWMYDFTSLSAASEYSIFMSGNNISKEIALPVNKTAQSDWLNYYSGRLPDSDWKVDSTQAVQIAMPYFRAKYGMNPVSAIYMLINSKLNTTDNAVIYWAIDLNPPSKDLIVNGVQTSGYEPFYVYIDAETGAVIPDPINITYIKSSSASSS